MHMDVSKIRYFFRDIKVGIKNLIIWFPVIWKDRWWDHYFLYVMLHKKLSLMEHNLRNYGCHVRAEEDAKKIKICVLLLKRLIDDKYHETAFKNHEKKWGEPKLEYIDLDDDNEYTELKIIYPNVKTEKDKEKETKEFKLSTKTQTQLLDQDLDLLFKIMRKYIQRWWD